MKKMIAANSKSITFLILAAVSLAGLLRRAKLLADRKSAKFHFVYLPELWPAGRRTEDNQSTRQRFLAIARQAGFPIIDLHAALSRKKLSDLFEVGYGHFNLQGAKIVADVALEYLRKNPPPLKAH